MPLRLAPRLPTGRPPAVTPMGCIAILSVLSTTTHTLLPREGTPHPSAIGRRAGAPYVCHCAPHPPIDRPIAATPMSCIARLNVTSNLTLLHFLPTSQITTSHIPDHRQLCYLLHPIQTDPRSHRITFRPSPQQHTTT